MATNAAFVAAIQDMEVTGINRHYREPPASIDTANLPVAFPGMPGGARPELIVSCISNNKTRSIDYTIITQATGQSRQKEKYAALAELMDNLETALDALSTNSQFPFMEYEITTTGNYAVGEQEYWAILATIIVADAR